MDIQRFERFWSPLLRIALRREGRGAERSGRAGERESGREMESTSEWEERVGASGATDVQVMREAWRREKGAPELLDFEGAAVQRLREQMEAAEDAEMKRQEKEKANGGGREEELAASLRQMDLDRAVFALKLYLRLRLRKIEKHPLFYASAHPDRLSPEEHRFCGSCGNSLSHHLQRSLLSHLPPHYQSLSCQSTSSEHDDMVDSPQLDTFVFCKTNTDVGAFQLDDMGEEIVDLVVDDLYVLRYKSIRGLVESRQIDLI